MRDVSPKERRLRDTGAREERADPAAVARALGAEPPGEEVAVERLRALRDGAERRR